MSARAAALVRRLLILLALLAPAMVGAAPTIPAYNDTPVVDAAHVLPADTVTDLSEKLRALKRDTGRQVVVATIPDLGGYPLEDYGNALIRGWGVGLKGVDNGAVLFIAPNEPKGHRGPRLEVGYGLEPVLTDGWSRLMIERDMLPRLRAGDVAGAMAAGTDAVVAQLRLPDDEAKAKLDAAVKRYDREHARGAGAGDDGAVIGVVLVVLVIGFVGLSALRRGSRGGGGGRRWTRPGPGGGSSWPIVLWAVADELSRNRSSGGGWGGGGSGWSGGRDSGSSDGGGGWMSGDFGAGGGSGGGGGASGDW